MKKGWRVERLGDIGKVSMCKRIFKDQTTTTGDIPFYKIGTFGKEPDAYISKEIYDEFRKNFSFPKKGDILISASGTIGRRVKYDGKPAYFQDSNIVWIDNDEKQVLNDYLYHFYGACNWNSTKGATISRLYTTNLQQIEIAYPPLPEQERIVTLLDESFAALAQVHANAARNLVNAREVFEGVLEQEFQNAKENHISKNITELCEIGDGNHGGNYPKKSDMRQSGVPFIRSVNLVNGHISDIDMRFISKEKHKSLKKGHLKTGDVLFTNRGEMGKSAVVDARYDDANLNSQIAFFRCSEQILPWYLYHILQSPFMQEHSTKSQTGAALQQLPIGIISKFEIPLPPLAEQRAIVQRLDGLARETRRLEEVYRQKVEDVEELRKSILKEQLSMDN